MLAPQGQGVLTIFLNNISSSAQNRYSDIGKKNERINWFLFAHKPQYLSYSEHNHSTETASKKKKKKGKMKGGMKEYCGFDAGKFA